MFASSSAQLDYSDAEYEARNLTENSVTVYKSKRSYAREGLNPYQHGPEKLLTSRTDLGLLFVC